MGVVALESTKLDGFIVARDVKQAVETEEIKRAAVEGVEVTLAVREGEGGSVFGCI